MDVIEISMLNAGQTLKSEYVSITQLVQEVLHELRNHALQKQLRILVNIEQQLPDCYCSREKVKLILYNLLDNSIKFFLFGRYYYFQLFRHLNCRKMLAMPSCPPIPGYSRREFSGCQYSRPGDRDSSGRTP